jgi:hypothetical protein
MKRIIICLIILTGGIFVNHAQNAKSIVSKVSQISYLPHWEQLNDTLYKLHCGDPIIWEVVSLGKDAIPFLIEMIKDSSDAKVTIECSVNGTRVGDLAFLVLEQIVNIPLAQVTGTQFCTVTDCGGFFMADGVFYLLAENRSQFSAQINRWYTQSKKKIKLVDLKDNYFFGCLTSDKVDVDFGLHR